MMTNSVSHTAPSAPTTKPRSPGQEFERLEQRLINEMLELLVTHHGGAMTDEGLDRAIDHLQDAIALGRASHAGQLRKSGEPYFIHPLRVAHMAARHWMDFASVMAAILHDVVEDTPVTLSEIESQFGAEVALLVDGLTKAENPDLNREALKAETYRKQLLTAIKDVRVLCLKVWDRVDNLQTIGALKPEKQSLIAEETRTVYMPLTRHLGMRRAAADLESLSLAVLYPRRAARYRQAVKTLHEQSEAYLRRMRGEIQHAFDQAKVPVLLKDRWRPFSIVAAQSAQRGLASLYTLEIQVDRTREAYIGLGLLHELYLPIPGKLRDHLRTPSQYGYQALKTTVQAAEHRIRVEITTRKLARFNEAGVLAPGFEFRQISFQQLMRSLLEGESAFDTESLRLASASIQVYTPRGEMRSLPEGSSVLDFAFDIHEELGLRAVRARINGQTRLLKARLMDGDQVAIESGETPSALPKWLEWAVTPKARNAIRRYLRSKVKEVGA